MGKKLVWSGAVALSLIVAVILTVGLAGQQGAQAAGKQELQVFAASVMTEAFEALAQEFERTHPQVDVKTNFAATSVLRFQVEQGAMPEVFESADLKNITALQQGGYIVGKIEPIAHNRLTVIVPASNPAGIRSLADLARPNLTLVACAQEVPVGAYTLQVLDKLQASGKFGKDYRRRVTANFRSLEPNVKGIVTKVVLGDADAGICYASDVNPEVAKRVKVIPIPEKYNVLATHYIGVVKGCRNPALGREFIKLVLSPMGQHILKCKGLVPVKPICAGK